MNKKFLSAILFGALMVTSTGTFVSCKDYDEDIENLRSQINNLATKSDVEAKLSQLQVAIDAAKAEAIAAAKEADATALGDVAAEVEAMLAKVQATVDEDMAKYKDEIAAVIAKAESMVGEIADFVTSVELVYSNSAQAVYRYVTVNAYKEKLANGEWTSEQLTNMRFEEVFETDEEGNEVLVGYTYYYAGATDKSGYEGQWLSTQTVTELDNNFGPSETSLIKFTKGTQHQRGDKFVVRVSPTNAVLTPEMISLVNSQGAVLDMMEVVGVKRYESLLTRSAEANGLWEVEVALKNYDKNTFNAAQYKKDAGYILYAVQVNNTLSTAETRNVVSTYDLSLNDHQGFTGLNRLYYFVNDTHVRNIATRCYSWGSNSLESNNWDLVSKLYKELTWDGNPAVAPIVEGAKKNVTINGVDVSWTQDVRPGAECYPAAQGVPMTITLTTSTNTSKVYDASSYIRGMYVTLDTKNAVESAPSELNAWNSYSYEGLNKVVEGTSTTITINAETAINDIIGFRVYAVNHDGTLADPDGKPFYVRLGKPAAETQTIAAVLAPKTADDKTVYVKLTDAQKAIVGAYYGVTPEVKASKDNKLITSGDYKQTESPVYSVEFVKDDKGTAAAKKEEMNYAKFTVSDLAQYIDGATYKQTLTFKNATNHVLGEVVCELVKTPFDTFPTDFAFRPKQETEEGSGKFIAYMVPENGYAVASEYGVKDLNNVFYGLNDDYEFVFGTSKYDADEDGTLDNVKVTSTGKDENENSIYNLKVSENATYGKFIDNETWHNVVVTYYYRNVSTYWNAEDEVWEVGVDHAVKYGKTLEAKYACWEDASAFAWGTEKVENAAVSLKPILKWTAEGVGAKAKLSDIVSTNSYNNDYFGLDLESLVNTNKWLAVDEIKLTAGEQENPYFKPSVSGSEIIFTQIKTQVDAAPTADHEETLTIVVKDAFGHKSTITLDVTVKAPEKK